MIFYWFFFCIHVSIFFFFGFVLFLFLWCFSWTGFSVVVLSNTVYIYLCLQLITNIVHGKLWKSFETFNKYSFTLHQLTICQHYGNNAHFKWLVLTPWKFDSYIFSNHKTKGNKNNRNYKTDKQPLGYDAGFVCLFVFPFFFFLLLF